MLPRVLAIVASILILYGAGSQNNALRKAVSQYTGMVTVRIPVSGTGSMYPTFPKGTAKTHQELADQVMAIVDMYVYPSGFVLDGKRYLGYQIARGDIVEFKNTKTDEIEKKEYGSSSGFIKRVIGLPRDILEIRDGQVIINDQVIKEPYTALSRSTFGGEFLPDCSKLQIPDNKYFVMGDNRKGSGDSRHDVGFVDEADIHFVLPKGKQLNKWDSHYRDISNDDKPTAKIKVDKQRYLELINDKRKAAGLKELKYSEKLEKSATLRGKNVIKFNDFSFEATRSSYKMSNALAEVGYWNPIYSEAYIQGFYQADEMIENIFELPKWKEFFLNKDFDDFGLAEVEGEINGCPTQVIVQHLAGYIPPSYTQEEINSWRESLNKLRQIQPGWSELSSKSEYSQYYAKNKIQIDRINEIISLRIKNSELILKKMESNQWLSQPENALIHLDSELGKEENELANKLNSDN